MDEKLLSWGWGGFGQLGHNSQTDVERPTEIAVPWAQSDEVYPVKVCGGEWHSVVVLSNGDVWSCGYGRHGALGQGYTDSSMIYRKVHVPDKVVDVACGQAHTFFITAGGKLYGCGWSGYGQLGLGTTDYYVKPTLIPIGGDADVIRVAARGHQSIFLASDGKVFQCGGGRLRPKQVCTLPFPATECVSFACPSSESPFKLFALSASGELYTTNRASRGGKLAPNLEYSLVAKKHGGIRSSYLEYNDLVILTNSGQLLRIVPQTGEVIEMGDAKYTQVSCGNRHTIGLTADGAVHVVGRNTQYQHGDGHNDIVPGMTVVALPEGMVVRRVFAGPDYNMVVSSPMCSLHRALTQVCGDETYADVTLCVAAGEGSNIVHFNKPIHGAVASAVWPTLYQSLAGRTDTDGASNGTASDDDWGGDDSFDQLWSLKVKDVISEQAVDAFVEMLYGRHLTGLEAETERELLAMCDAASVKPIQIGARNMRLVASPTVMRDHARTLWTSGVGSDITIRVIAAEEGADDVRVPAHRFLLAARSPYFSGMFRTGARLGDSMDEIEVHANGDIEAGVNLIKYMYGYTIKDLRPDPSMAYDMLQMAGYFLLDDLKRDPELKKRIKRGLASSNVVPLYQVGVDQQIDWLARLAVDYIVAHHSRCAKSPSYQDLPEAVRVMCERRVEKRERTHKKREEEDKQRRRKKKKDKRNKGKSHRGQEPVNVSAGNSTAVFSAFVDKCKSRWRDRAGRSQDDS